MSHETVLWYDDGDIRCVLEIQRKRVFLHLKIAQGWTPSKCRFILSRLAAMRSALRTAGFAKLEVYFPTANPQVGKMAKLFGFRETSRKAKWTLMEIQNA